MQTHPHWNEIATTVTTTKLTMAPPFQSRIYAMTHAAIHDPLMLLIVVMNLMRLHLNQIWCVFQAAVATAAYRVLLQGSDQQTILMLSIRHHWRVFGQRVQDQGCIDRSRAAAAIIALRTGDGSTRRCHIRQETASAYGGPQDLVSLLH
jgi:hypothetical protein